MREIDMSPRPVVRFTRGGKITYPNVVPQVVTKERADEIWAARGLQHALTMTIEEEAYIRAVWDAMERNAAFMDAFHIVRRGVFLVNAQKVVGVDTGV